MHHFRFCLICTLERVNVFDCVLNLRVPEGPVMISILADRPLAAFAASSSWRARHHPSGSVLHVVAAISTIPSCPLRCLGPFWAAPSPPSRWTSHDHDLGHLDCYTRWWNWKQSVFVLLGQVIVHAHRIRRLRVTGSLLPRRVLTTAQLSVLIFGVFRKGVSCESPSGSIFERTASPRNALCWIVVWPLSRSWRTVLLTGCCMHHEAIHQVTRFFWPCTWIFNFWSLLHFWGPGAHVWKYRVVELMRIPQLLRRISQCSTVLLSDLNKGFLFASLWAFIGNTAGSSSTLSKNCTFDLSKWAVIVVASLLGHRQPRPWICMCELVSLLDRPNGCCLFLHHHRDEFALGTVNATMALHGGQCQGTFSWKFSWWDLVFAHRHICHLSMVLHLGYTCDDLHLLYHRLLVLHHNEHVDNLELFLQILHDPWTVCTARREKDTNVAWLDCPILYRWPDLELFAWPGRRTIDQGLRCWFWCRRCDCWGDWDTPFHLFRILGTDLVECGTVCVQPLLRYHVDVWAHLERCCVAVTSYPQPPDRGPHGCTVGIDRDPPVWHLHPSRAVEVPERQLLLAWLVVDCGERVCWSLIVVSYCLSSSKNKWKKRKNNEKQRKTKKNKGKQRKTTKNKEKQRKTTKNKEQHGKNKEKTRKKTLKTKRKTRKNKEKTRKNKEEQRKTMENNGKQWKNKDRKLHRVVSPLAKSFRLGVPFLYAHKEENNKNMLGLLRPSPSSAPSNVCGQTRSIARPKRLARYPHNARGFGLGFKFFFFSFRLSLTF